MRYERVSLAAESVIEWASLEKNVNMQDYKLVKTKLCGSELLVVPNLSTINLNHFGEFCHCAVHHFSLLAFSESLHTELDACTYRLKLKDAINSVVTTLSFVSGLQF